MIVPHNPFRGMRFRPAAPGRTRTGPTETGPTETGPTETGPTETGPTEARVATSRPDPVWRAGRRAFLRASALAAIVLARPLTALAQQNPSPPGGRRGRGPRPDDAGGPDGGPPPPEVSIDPSVTTLPNPAAGPAWGTTKELVIGFKYVVGDGDRFHNPYVAVWIEDAVENAVRTVKLEYQQGRGERWLPELRRWFYRDQVRITTGGKANTATISGPTRVPGTYKVMWDGRDANKQPVRQGAYYVCIEAARERGPYQVIREKVDLGTKTFTKKIADNGDLRGVQVELRTRAK